MAWILPLHDAQEPVHVDEARGAMDAWSLSSPMADPLDPKDLVTIEDLAISSM